jgi:hypothetical protein
MTKHLWFVGVVLNCSVTVAEINFESDVWPIFETQCIECHGPEKQKEDLRFDDLLWLQDDELLGAGNVADSMIYASVILNKDEEGFMPKKREPLSTNELEILKQWINEGGKAEGWIVPEIILTKKMTSSEKRLSALAEGVPPAPKEALEAIRAVNGIAIPLANNNNLIRVDFGLRGGMITDATLSLLDPLTDHLTELGLANSKISDTGLAQLTKFTKLTKLHIGNTQISGKGIQHLSGLSNLESLNLINTFVDDSGLKLLDELEFLSKVYAWRSLITRKGAEESMNQHEMLLVDRGIEDNAKSDTPTLPLIYVARSCCANAQAQDKTCQHDCCIETAKEQKICLECNPAPK